MVPVVKLESAVLPMVQITIAAARNHTRNRYPSELTNRHSETSGGVDPGINSLIVYVPTRSVTS